jgi:hypothetical protein
MQKNFGTLRKGGSRFPVWGSPFEAAPGVNGNVSGGHTLFEAFEVPGVAFGPRAVWLCDRPLLRFRVSANLPTTHAR